MNEKLNRLAERRAFLIDQSAQQRAALSREAEPWRNLLAYADQGVAALRYAKSHPAWLVGTGGMLLAAVGPRRILRWLGRGLFAWRMIYRFNSR